MTWKCPKCGREFSRRGQSHFCGETPQRMEDYIMTFDSDIQDRLWKVRDVLRRSLPGYHEGIVWGMPVWQKDMERIHIAVNKGDIGIYPGPEAIAHFAPKFDELHLSYEKGMLKLPFRKDLPLDLIREIAEWCGARS